MGDEISKLGGRQRALAQAKIIEAPKHGESDAMVAYNINNLNPPAIDPLEEHNKKKRKLAHQEQLADFVCPPKPKPRSKLEIVNKRPFRPIAALAQLVKPPPSVEGTKSKRNYTRPRRSWTEAETNCLKRGIAICGVGRWKDILEHPNLKFQEGRTHVDLKDRFRTLYPPKQPNKGLKLVAGKEGDSDDIPGAVQPSPQRQRAPYKGWLEEEDAELDKGFRIHGFQWHLIAQDDSLHFNNRSANQIRDRFRRRFPDTYRKQPPFPLIEKARKENIKKRRKDLDTSKAPRRRGIPKGPGSKKGASQRIASSSSDEQSHGSNLLRITHDSKVMTPCSFDGLLNGSKKTTQFSDALAVSDDRTLPSLHWDDMAVQPIFDLG
ncbi:MAG: hypothetical protein Q9164_000024 [Protoblastenia rupestris]